MLARRLTFVIGVAVLLWGPTARANGGGYAFGVQFTGSVAPFQASGTEQVRILEEKLEVDLRRTAAVVTVRYTMRNLASEPVRVRFGFPVETTSQDDFMGEEEQPGESLSDARRRDLRASIKLLEGYTVTADGKPVKAEFQVEPFATGKVKPFSGSEVLKGIAGWMVSEVTYPAGQPLTLEINYSAPYAREGHTATDDDYLEGSFFKYRLSTGAVWNGPIEKGTVVVRADGIAPEEVRVEQGHLQHDGRERWVRGFANLKPTLDDDIYVRAIPGCYVPGLYGQRNGPYRRYIQRGGRDPREDQQGWGGAHTRYKATASSTLAPIKGHRFGPENLATEPNGASITYPWSEGVPGPGLGEWVELVPQKPNPLLALGVYSGFQSGALFQKNGRPSRVEIELNGEHRFTATLGDVMNEQLIPIVGYTKPVARIRITIRDVYPGTQFEDTCINRILLYDLLPKRPDISVAR
jgi:hypothetical protein